MVIILRWINHNCNYFVALVMNKNDCDYVVAVVNELPKTMIMLLLLQRNNAIMLIHW